MVRKIFLTPGSQGSAKFTLQPPRIISVKCLGLWHAWSICRGYYRCAYRNSEGCLATKQVQRRDEDPTSFQTTYRGHHTCHMHHSIPPLNLDSIDDSVTKSCTINSERRLHKSCDSNELENNPHEEWIITPPSSPAI